MSDAKAGVFFWVIIWILVMIVFGLCGCATLGATLAIDKIPASGWESTMNAIAKTNWFGTFCLLSFFGGVVAIGLDQRKIGGAIVIAAISTLCLGLAIHRFPTWLAIIGFASSIIAVGYSILIKNKALVEIVRGVQNYRTYRKKHPTFENTTLIDMELAEQSDSTKKIVKQIKGELK